LDELEDAVSARRLLDQLLQSGQSLVKEATGHLQGSNGGQPARTPEGGAAGGLGGLGNLLGSGSKAGGGLGSLLSGFGGGALSGSALTMLLSNKKMRKMGGSVAMMGGMAALGAVAYRAYSDWQRNQQGAAGAAAGTGTGAPITGTATVEPHQAPAGQAAPLGLPEPQTLDRVTGAQAEEHSNAVLVAMIGASKADGHIGADERQLLEGELHKLSTDPADRAWLEAELAKPLDPAAVARSATTPEIAAEMYLASLLIVDEESYMERAYLDELARQMKLDPGLKATLEAQLKQAA
jgi:uncharacterized membrane protein YebE (DUF533 family)